MAALLRSDLPFLFRPIQSLSRQLPLPAITVPIFSRLAPLSFNFSIPSLPSLWDSIWEGILRAVPKKRTTHGKARSRRLGAGKDLKDLINLNRCSACGRVKRRHFLCPYCVQNMKDLWGGSLKNFAEARAKVMDSKASSQQSSGQSS